MKVHFIIHLFRKSVSVCKVESIQCYFVVSYCNCYCCMWNTLNFHREEVTAAQKAEALRSEEQVTCAWML